MIASVSLATATSPSPTASLALDLAEVPTAHGLLTRTKLDDALRHAMTATDAAVTTTAPAAAAIAAAESSVWESAPQPDSLALWHPWLATQRTHASRRARAGELLGFLRWAQAQYLVLPCEVTEHIVAHYGLWLEHQAVDQGRLAPATARRRYYTARAALRWRRAQEATHETAQHEEEA